MKKVLIAFSLALALPACNPAKLAEPAPLAQTTIDEKTLVVALQTFDTALTAVDRLIAAKVIVPGSPRAIQIADAIKRAKQAYKIASAAQRVGNQQSYFAALLQAQQAVGEISVLLGGN